MNTWFGQDFLFTMVFIGHLLEIALDTLYVFGMNEMYFVRLEDIWKKVTAIGSYFDHAF